MNNNKKTSMPKEPSLINSGLIIGLIFALVFGITFYFTNKDLFRNGLPIILFFPTFFSIEKYFEQKSIWKKYDKEKHPGKYAVLEAQKRERRSNIAWTIFTILVIIAAFLIVKGFLDWWFGVFGLGIGLILLILIFG